MAGCVGGRRQVAQEVSSSFPSVVSSQKVTMHPVPQTEVDISVSCKNLRDRDGLSKSDPLCVVYMKEFNSDHYKEIGRTECMENNLNPVFATKFRVNYYFEESQKMKFEIYDKDSLRKELSDHDFLGSVEVTLGQIVGASGSINMPLSTERSTRKGANAGTILIAAEEVGSNKDVVLIHWRALKLDKKDFMGKSDPFIEVYRVNDDRSRLLIHRSEVVMNDLNPIWKPFTVPLQRLIAGNENRFIEVECFDADENGGHDLIGSCQTSFARLKQGKGPMNVCDLINLKKQAKKKNYKNSGTLELIQFEQKVEHSFLDYIRGGTQIHFTVAVDFTASNGNPTDARSLHYIHPHEPNQYMIALQSVGEIIQDYDNDKMFPALGFGAKVPPEYEVSHEFFLNFHPTDPLCRGVEGILAAYRQAIMSVQLYGPTNFAPVIYHVAKFAQAASRDGSHYFVLLIVTDGIVTDMERTVDAIVHASALPMSIIIVGVGCEDFAAMEILDSDKKQLRASNGTLAQRDIVQFVPFKKYQHSGINWVSAQAALAKDVLCEVPKQLTSWMRSRGIVPKPPPTYTEVHPQPVSYPPGIGGAIPQSAYYPQSQNYAPLTAYSHVQGTSPIPPPPAYSVYNQAPTAPPPY